MYGLDLFSGIGGITKALEGYVTPVAYCENDRYAQGVLLSRMAAGDLPLAPIWDDVTTLRGTYIPRVDIIYGGFPCQDISVAGRGEGLAGKRSGLYFEIVRLVCELRPRFVFLENVSAITVRGAERVVGELCKLRYDARWGILSATDVGANHQRERWWLLAHFNDSARCSEQGEQQKIGAEIIGGSGATRRPQMANAGCQRIERAILQRKNGMETQKQNADQFERPDQMADTYMQHSEKLIRGNQLEKATREKTLGWRDMFDRRFWESEPDVVRVVHGVQHRVDRIKCLGNAVVPAQAREAFERLMGLK